MGKLKDIANKLAGITPDAIDAKILQIIRDNQTLIIDLNLFQLDSGKDSNDVPLDPPYRNANYAEFKLYLNPKGVVDLRVTGRFWAGFFMKADKFPITFGSTDEKAGALEAKYGKEIFGLDKQHLEEVSRGMVLPLLQSYLREAIHVWEYHTEELHGNC